MSRVVHDTLYLLTPIGLYKIPGFYGIIGGTTEQRVLQFISTASAVGICIALWGRLVDDYFEALTGIESEKQEIITAFKFQNSRPSASPQGGS